jgi:hypothetical protein
MGDKPRITQNELMKNLVSARKIMSKVNTGDYEKGNIDESLLTRGTEELLDDETPAQPSIRPVGKADPDKINQSKLPDAIKRAMIENPIPEISLNDSLDMDFVNKTRKLMEADGTIPVKRTLNESRQAPTQQSSNRQGQTESRQINESSLEKMIESTIRRVLDEKLTQILNAQDAVAINENLVIKVGESLFSGKITKVKSSK